MDWFKLSYVFLGGLGLFFFGMKSLTEGLQTAGSGWIRKVINSLTSNRITAVIVGLVITCIVQSSSVTTVMVVGFVNAGLMSLSQAIGVIFGANVGTTITGWLLTLKISKYSLLLIGFGIFPFLFVEKPAIKNLGKVLFSVGLVFLGLKYMSGAFKPLRTHEGFIDFLTYFSAKDYLSLWATISVGCLLTFMIQSSSAMLGITIALATTGVISFQTALALVMGENIGTTITALLASIGATTAAKRAAYAHGLFNVFGVLVLSIFFWSYKDLVESIVPGVPDLMGSEGNFPNMAAHIAAGHTIFNVTNVIVFLPLLNQLQRIVEWMVPEPKKKEIHHLEFFGSTTVMSASLALEQAQQELNKMADIVETCLENANAYISSPQEEAGYVQKIDKYEAITDNLQKEFMIFLGRVMETKLSAVETQRVTSILRLSDELESIADYCQSLTRHGHRFFQNDLQLDIETKDELSKLMNATQKLFLQVKKMITSGADIQVTEYEESVKQITQLSKDFRDNYLEKVGAGKYSPLSALTLNDLILSYVRIKNHTVNLAEASLVGKATLTSS